MKQVLKMSAISTALLTLPMMANADVLASVKPSVLLHHLLQTV